MSPVIIALDFRNRLEVMNFLNQFQHPEKLFVKIGMELFYSEGPQIVKDLRAKGIKVFLDLKLYDIPSIVEKAVKQLAKLDVQLITVHASGGEVMLKAAKRGAENSKKHLKILAVTQLTSTSEEQMQRDQLISVDLKTSVTHLAKMAYQCGIDGTISSALEDPMIHKATGNDFKCINPGIRLVNNSNDDQKRVVTPEKAHQLGSNGIVVGRAITKASDPVKAYQKIVKAF
ncbi:orotidine 5'-phosphate decarboxylase [Philodulcilactobacillus myokoensis]|uniref:Orotidine 5'-phosphate decarboxylase n=1 Tax=Philodulcilactobacillus myokoensis TaxID=2929573 RepID=A0A9W6B2J2_9LACO|nr:orotidine 5'-phosphate decarboxylase [Philodulcilactobacillus myokoensis]